MCASRVITAQTDHLNTIYTKQGILCMHHTLVQIPFGDLYGYPGPYGTDPSVLIREVCILISELV